MSMLTAAEKIASEFEAKESATSTETARLSKRPTEWLLGAGLICLGNSSFNLTSALSGKAKSTDWVEAAIMIAPLVPILMAVGMLWHMRIRRSGGNRN